MMIDEFHTKNRSQGLSEDKEIKVKIPLEYHIKLHTVKVVRGQNISDTVKIALDNYFRELRTDQAAQHAQETTVPAEFAAPRTPFMHLRQ